MLKKTLRKMERLNESSDGSVAKSLEYGDKTGTEDSHRMKIAEREQRRVAELKVAMILVLTLVTMLLSSAAYIFVTQSEQDVFEKDVSKAMSNQTYLLKSSHPP